MNVYLYRHGHALDLPFEEERPLSEKGLLQVSRMARFLQKQKSFSVDEIWHSSLLRARETAEHFAMVYGVDIPVQIHPELNPYDSIDAVVDSLLHVESNVLVVGHQPQLEKIALELLHGDPAWAMFNFKKGAMLALQYKKSLWQVRWMLTPQLLK